MRCLKLAHLALLKLLYYCVWLGFAYTLSSIIDNLQGQGVIMVSLFSQIKAKAKLKICDLNLACQVCILYIFIFTPPTDATHIIRFVWSVLFPWFYSKFIVIEVLLIKISKSRPIWEINEGNHIQIRQKFMMIKQ